MNYAYLHGFASGSESKKGQDLAERLAPAIELKRPNLNNPSFSKLTYDGMLEAVDQLDAAVDDEPWRFVGSSLGGYIAARWTELNPDRVDSLVLLCPGFDMASRWRVILGDERLKEWREEGDFLFFDAEGTFKAVHWELYRQARDDHPKFPEVSVPVTIVHGRNDEIVKIELSRQYAEAHDNVELVEVDDEHTLYESVDEIERVCRNMWGL